MHDKQTLCSIHVSSLWIGNKLCALQKGGVGQWGRQEKGVGSTAQQLRLRDSMLADLRSQNKALAGTHCTAVPHTQLQVPQMHSTRPTSDGTVCCLQWGPTAASDRSCAILCQWWTKHRDKIAGMSKSTCSHKNIAAAAADFLYGPQVTGCSEVV